MCFSWLPGNCSWSFVPTLSSSPTNEYALSTAPFVTLFFSYAEGWYPHSLLVSDPFPYQSSLPSRPYRGACRVVSSPRGRRGTVRVPLKSSSCCISSQNLRNPALQIHRLFLNYIILNKEPSFKLGRVVKSPFGIKSRPRWHFLKNYTPNVRNFLGRIEPRRPRHHIKPCLHSHVLFLLAITCLYTTPIIIIVFNETVSISLLQRGWFCCQFTDTQHNLFVGNN